MAKETPQDLFPGGKTWVGFMNILSQPGAHFIVFPAGRGTDGDLFSCEGLRKGMTSFPVPVPGPGARALPAETMRQL
jgi:hypothetical protein